MVEDISSLQKEIPQETNLREEYSSDRYLVEICSLGKGGLQKNIPRKYCCHVFLPSW